MQTPPRTPYPTDIGDEEWLFVAPYLALLREDAGQSRHDLREVFNALRSIVHAGAPWRLLPTNFPPWEAVYRQARRWLEHGCFKAIVHDRRALPRLAQSRAAQSTAAILDRRTLPSSPMSSPPAGKEPSGATTRRPTPPSTRATTSWRWW